MSNFGAKVSLPGFDVGSAADQDLYFNSSWPVLKIDDDLSNQITNYQLNQSVITHNLGYPPFTMVFSKQGGFLGPAKSVNSTTVTLNTVDNNGISMIGDTIQYYIFRNPLNINFQAPVINVAQVQQGTNHENWGIKFAKPGKSTDSTDLRDFTIHSGTKSLQVHQVIYSPLGTIQGDTYNGVWGLKYLTDLPYNPVFFAFFSSDNINFSPLTAIAQVPPKITFDQIDGGIVINDANGNSGWGVFYIFLDPYQTTTNIVVNL